MWCRLSCVHARRECSGQSDCCAAAGRECCLGEGNAVRGSVEREGHTEVFHCSTRVQEPVRLLRRCNTGISSDNSCSTARTSNPPENLTQCPTLYGVPTQARSFACPLSSRSGTAPSCPPPCPPGQLHPPHRPPATLAPLTLSFSSPPTPDLLLLLFTHFQLVL
jgi:hypothetical protein